MKVSGLNSMFCLFKSKISCFFIIGTGNSNKLWVQRYSTVGASHRLNYSSHTDWAYNAEHSVILSRNHGRNRTQAKITLDMHAV